MKKRCRRQRQPALLMPAVWGTTRTAAVELGVRERAAADAILAVKGTEDDWQVLRAACEAAILAVDEGLANPELHQLEEAGLRDARAALVECAQCLLSLRDRHARVGRWVCNGIERAAIVALCDHLDVLRQELPRRLWLRAYEKLVGSVTPIPRTPRLEDVVRAGLATKEHSESLLAAHRAAERAELEGGA